MEINEILKKANDERQTVKVYSDKTIEQEKWNAILDSVYWAPTSHGLEPYRLLIINRSNKLRDKIKPVMWNQGQITNADKIVLFVSMKRSAFMSKEFVANRLSKMYQTVKGLSGDNLQKTVNGHVALIFKQLEEQEKGDDWAMKQAYLALGIALHTAILLEIGSTPMEGFIRVDLDGILRDENLIDSEETVAVAAAFGYPESTKAYSHFGSGKRFRVSRDEKFTEI